MPSELRLNSGFFLKSYFLLFWLNFDKRLVHIQDPSQQLILLKDFLLLFKQSQKLLVLVVLLYVFYPLTQPFVCKFSHHYVWRQLIFSYSLITRYKSPTIRQSYPFEYIEFYHRIVLFAPHCIELCHCFPKEYINLNPPPKPLLLIFLLYFLLNFLFNFFLYFFLIIKVQ